MIYSKVLELYLPARQWSPFRKLVKRKGDVISGLVGSFILVILSPVLSLSFGRFWDIRRIYSFLPRLFKWKVILFLRPILYFGLWFLAQKVLSYTANLQFPWTPCLSGSTPVSSPYTLYLISILSSFLEAIQPVYDFPQK